MRLFALAAAALMLATAALCAPPFGVKGLRPGMTLEEMRKEYPSFRCSEPTDDWFETCGYSRNPYGNYSEQFPHIAELDSVAGADVSTLSVEFGPGGRIAEIDITSGSSQYDKLLTALTEKFGKPTVSRVRDYENRFGARFRGREANWLRGSQFMILTEYAGSTETLTLVLGDHKLVAGLNARKAASARKKAHSDL